MPGTFRSLVTKLKRMNVSFFAMLISMGKHEILRVHCFYVDVCMYACTWRPVIPINLKGDDDFRAHENVLAC